MLPVAVTERGRARLAAGHPQLGLDDVVTRDGLEPGRPLRLLGAREAVLATGLADPENEVVRVFARGEVRALDAGFFRAQLEPAWTWRRQMGLGDGRSAYRLVNGEGDGLPGLTFDVYGRFGVVTAYSRGLLACARLLGHAGLAVLPAQGVPLEGVVVKTRLRATQGPSPPKTRDEVLGQEPPEVVIAYEHDVPYEVHLRGGTNVGLFTDMREHRRGLARFVRNRRVLNTFAYTGSLSVAAARAGAAQITSVDLAAGTLAWAKQNFRHAGLDPDAPAYSFVTSDVMKFLRAAHTAGERWDVIILDPPTVSGAGARSWAQKSDYPALIAAAIGVLPEAGVAGGHLWVSSNTHAGPALLKTIEAGLTLAQRRATVLEVGGLPPDYPTPLAWPAARYLDVVQLRIEA